MGLSEEAFLGMANTYTGNWPIPQGQKGDPGDWSLLARERYADQKSGSMENTHRVILS